VLDKRLGIYSYSTADAYRDVWKQFLSYAKSSFGVKEIKKFNSEAFSTLRLSRGLAKELSSSMQLHLKNWK